MSEEPDEPAAPRDEPPAPDDAPAPKPESSEDPADGLASLFGEAADKAALYALIEQELRRIAMGLGRNLRGHTMQPTALVNEAWIRLLGNRTHSWTDRAHFICAAARTMRHILVDYARRKLTQKRNGGIECSTLDELMESLAKRSKADLLDLDAALQKLAVAHSEAARYVDLRFFAGLTNEEAAQMLGRSARYGSRLWEFARAFLHDQLSR